MGPQGSTENTTDTPLSFWKFQGFRGFLQKWDKGQPSFFLYNKYLLVLINWESNLTFVPHFHNFQCGGDIRTYVSELLWSLEKLICIIYVKHLEWYLAHISHVEVLIISIIIILFNNKGYYYAVLKWSLFSL